MYKYLPFVFLLFTGSISAQTTRNVPAQYSTIQAALNAAQSGDTVLVQPGTYSENLTWPTINGIKLIAAGDTSNTIIDGRNMSSIIYMSTNGIIDATTLIRGFALVNGGNVVNGGGIFISHCSPKMENCLIRDCNGGGAIYLIGSNLIVYDLVIRNIYGVGIDCKNNSNSILRKIKISGCYNGGYGIYCDNSSPTITDAIIENNYESGIINAQSNLLLENVTIRNNIAQQGAGVRVLGGFTTINNSTIANNIATNSYYGGGGLYGCSITIRNSKIIGNVAYYGGGIYSLGNLILENCVLSDNTANKNGGGIYLKNDCSYSTTIKKTTFSRNIALEGGALHFNSDIYNLGNQSIENSTFAENRSVSAGAIFCNYVNLRVQGTNFINNNCAIYNNTNAVTIQVGNNWWGDYTGPYNISQNINGKGDTVSNFLNFMPFIFSPDTSAPPIPAQNVKITGSSQNSISVAWDSSFIGDLSGYRIYYDTDSNAFLYANKIDVGNVTSYTIPSLITGKKYYFKVTCYDIGNNESWYSKTISAVTTPAARISSSVDTLSFGQSDTYILNQKYITITNDGTADLVISSITTNNSTFTVNSSSNTITPGSNKNIIVSFYPTDEKSYVGNLIIQSNAINSPTFIIPLKGYGLLPTTPKIFSVNDVPNDQGGFVRIKFQRSRYDGIDTTKQISTYTVWRQFETNSWDALGYFNAIQDSIYYYVAPTLGDSTITSGIFWTIYRVSAHTSDPDVFFMSDSAKGFSVDNLIPHIPTGLGGLTDGNNVIIVHWNKNSDPDIQYYRVYRDTISGFAAGSINFHKNTIDTIYVDSTVTKNRKYYYRLIAVDFAGNSSNASAEFSLVVTDVMSQTALPHFFSLDQNYPNPFNPTTTISYALPYQSMVRIRIFNMLGQLVSELINTKQNAGHQSVIWNATVASGLYFYRIEATDLSNSNNRFTDTKKMILLR